MADSRMRVAKRSYRSQKTSRLVNASRGQRHAIAVAISVPSCQARGFVDLAEQATESHRSELFSIRGALFWGAGAV